MSAFDAIPSLLSHLTTPDTAVIRHAEASLKPLLKDPACVAHLMGSLRNPSAPAAVRQVAAVILCKRIGAHYMTFQAQTKAEFRAVLLSCLQNEPERSVRRTTVSAVARLASIEITGEGNNWPEVLPFIASATSAPAPEAREVRMERERGKGREREKDIQRERSHYVQHLRKPNIYAHTRTHTLTQTQLNSSPSSS